jgi:flagellar assembly protein FliH
MMYSSDSNKVVKAQDIKLTDPPATARHERAGSRNKAPGRFIRGICHIPSNKEDFNARKNKRDIDAEIEEPGKQVEERIKIAEKEAYNRGFSKGLAEGIERKKRELSLAVESVAKLTRELKILKEELLKSSEKKIIDLVFLIAGKVIHKEVSTGREVVLSVLKDAMKNMQERDGVSICLNPEDHRYITEAKPDFLDSFGDILIEKDEKIGQGGAVIKTHSVTLDARLDQQLDKIREQVSEG